MQTPFYRLSSRWGQVASAPRRFLLLPSQLLLFLLHLLPVVGHHLPAATASLSAPALTSSSIRRRCGEKVRRCFRRELGNGCRIRGDCCGVVVDVVDWQRQDDVFVLLLHDDAGPRLLLSWKPPSTTNPKRVGSVCRGRRPTASSSLGEQAVSKFVLTRCRPIPTDCSFF